ncbi:hypothetical protein RSOL_396040, partial [Rhizoctonia solani AG-3 Rhs1AP]
MRKIACIDSWHGERSSKWWVPPQAVAAIFKPHGIQIRTQHVFQISELLVMIAQQLDAKKQRMLLLVSKHFFQSIGPLVQAPTLCKLTLRIGLSMRMVACIDSWHDERSSRWWVPSQAVAAIFKPHGIQIRTQHVIQISELLVMIAQQLDAKKQRILLLVSKHFFQSIGPLVWKRVPGLDVIMKLIKDVKAEFNRSRVRGYSGWYDHCRWTLTLPSNPDLSRYEIYSPWIHELEIFAGKDQTLLMPETWFPSLKNLRLYDVHPEDVKYLWSQPTVAQKLVSVLIQTDYSELLFRNPLFPILVLDCKTFLCL